MFGDVCNKKWNASLRRASVIAVMTCLGCQSYSQQPLSVEAVDYRLKPPSDDRLQADALKVKHPMLAPIQLHPDEGLTPDGAAILAVLMNPGLRSARDQRGIAAAALLQAGLLPNPVLTYSSDFVTGGYTVGAFNAYGATLSWDFEQLISHGAKQRAAALSAESVDLSVAWQEWQLAQGARQAMYDLISLQAQLAVLGDIDRRLTENLHTIQRAESGGLQTAVDLAAAEAAVRDSGAAVLQAKRDVDHQWFQLLRALGLPSDHRPKIRAGVTLPSTVELGNPEMLNQGLEQRRIDLVALHRGYESQEQTLRAAVLDQFPKINIGFNGASDNSNVHSVGLVATIDLPIFDRNQGVIAAERATRQRLFDEYVSRVFDSRADIATAVADLKAISGQIADAQAAIPNLERLVDGYKKAMTLGAVDVLSYYVAWNNLAQKRLGILRLQQQLADTRIALELAAGRCFPESSPSQPAVRTEAMQ